MGDREMKTALVIAALVLSWCAATVTHSDGTIVKVPWPMQYGQRKGSDMWFVGPSDRSIDAATTVSLKLAATVPEALLATAERAAKDAPK